MTTAAQRPDSLWAAGIWAVDVPPLPAPPTFEPAQETGATMERIDVGQVLITLDEAIDASAVIPTVHIYEIGMGQTRAYLFPLSDLQWVALTVDVVANVAQLFDGSFAFMLERTANGGDFTS